MPFCGLASTWAKVSAFLSIVALALQSAGSATNYWMSRYTFRDKLHFVVGLWKVTNCSGNYKAPCTVSEVPASYQNDKVTAVRALECVALALMFLCAVCLILYVGSRTCRRLAVACLAMTMLFLAAIMGIAGMAVWVNQIPELHYPGWSFGLTVVAITFNIAAGVLLIPDLAEYDYKTVLQHEGHYDNLAQEEGQAMSDGGGAQPSDYRDDVRPIIETQGPKGAPVFQYLNYDKRKKRDGF
ncbi:hypothetical protein DPMN_113533 [Dreissena polymorpha]|uniref:Uncharacterized protein n=1 Tax=Dreissena polymorpha TaxID=45954 RepID=A0A9D4QQR9_DREPO|nr:hypothetical protein DPMN_113533 [Dreissena polymorpha]